MILAEFLRARALETYPEPPSAGHDAITAQMVPEVCKWLKPGASVLDVGCGQGVAIKEFKAQGCKVVGTTLNQDDWLVLNSNTFTDILLMDMHDMPEQWTGCFDLVWARHVLEHSVAPFFALHEFARVLKPEGWLYIEVPGPDTSCFHESNRNHYSVLGDRAWQCLIGRAGFEVMEVRQMSLQTPAGPDKYFGYICKRQSNH